MTVLLICFLHDACKCFPHGLVRYLYRSPYVFTV